MGGKCSDAVRPIQEPQAIAMATYCTAVFAKRFSGDTGHHHVDLVDQNWNQAWT